MTKVIFSMLVVCFFIPFRAFSWGFYAHKKINQLAVFTLPPEMIVFYKRNLGYITEKAVNPDKRRYIIKEEAPRHYIDLDIYKSYGKEIPKGWKMAEKLYSRDTLMRHGVVPWHILLLKRELTEAFREKDAGKIVRISADIGHYIGDANVPLHTTSNYNGQFTGQHGIHGFWESRLPELFCEEYDFFTGPAQYIDNMQELVWNKIFAAHAALDSVLQWEKKLNNEFAPDRIYSFEERGGVLVKAYSKEYSAEYHRMLDGQVERQMRSAVKMTGDIWFTAWVDAGKPDLDLLNSTSISEEEGQPTNGADHHDCQH